MVGIIVLVVEEIHCKIKISFQSLGSVLEQCRQSWSYITILFICSRDRIHVKFDNGAY